MERNKDLSFRKPEATFPNRILAFNKTEVDRFYENLLSVFEKHHYGPGRIFNIDETGLTTVQKSDRIIVEKAVKQIGASTSWEGGKTLLFVAV